MNYKEKMDNPSYKVTRKYITDLVNKKATHILDVGCSVGNLGKLLLENRDGLKVYGIENNRQMANEAMKHYDGVSVEDIDNIVVSELFEGIQYDVIVFADVLEHLVNPWETLNMYCTSLTEMGEIIISVPNISHCSTICNLLFLDKWPYRSRGIHDKTHLRFFTLKGVIELLDYADLELIQIKRRFRLLESIGLGPLNKIDWIFNLPIIKRFFTFQIIVLAKKKVHPVN